MKSITRRVGLRKKPNIASCRIRNVLSLRHFLVFCSFSFIYYLCYLSVYNFELCHYYLFIYLFTFLCFSLLLLLFVCLLFVFILQEEVH